MTKASDAQVRQAGEIVQLQQSLDTLAASTKLVSTAEPLVAAQNAITTELEARRNQLGAFQAALDAANATTDYSAALQAAQAALAAPSTLPSARVLQTMQQVHQNSYTAFIRAQSEATRQHISALPWSAAEQAAFEAEAQASVDKRCAIEKADTQDFESWRQAYLAPEHLQPVRLAA